MTLLAEDNGGCFSSNRLVISKHVRRSSHRRRGSAAGIWVSDRIHEPRPPVSSWWYWAKRPTCSPLAVSA